MRFLSKNERLVYLAFLLGELCEMKEAKGEVLSNSMQTMLPGINKAFEEPNTLTLTFGDPAKQEEIQRVEAILRKVGAWTDSTVECPDCKTVIGVTDQDFALADDAHKRGLKDELLPHLVCPKCGLKLHMRVHSAKGNEGSPKLPPSSNLA